MTGRTVMVPAGLHPAVDLFDGHELVKSVPTSARRTPDAIAVLSGCAGDRRVLMPWTRLKVSASRCT